MLKNVAGYSKRAGDHPGTVDCTSKLHSSTLGSRVWGKGDYGPFESPLRRSNLGLLQSIQYRYRIHVALDSFNTQENETEEMHCGKTQIPFLTITIASA